LVYIRRKSTRYGPSRFSKADVAGRSNVAPIGTYRTVVIVTGDHERTRQSARCIQTELT
jgi:hypothetical protein